MRIHIFILLMICVGKSYSQTNRYSTVTTSNYTPSATPSPDYYRAISQQKIERIKEAMTFYDTNVNRNLSLNTDYEFRQDMLEVNSYLQALKDANSMDLDQAEHYVNVMAKKYNKAIKRYNKRLKKANKK